MEGVDNGKVFSWYLRVRALCSSYSQSTDVITDVKEGGVDDFEIEQLDLASHHLAQSWEALQQCLPDADKARKDDAPPDFETVLASVKQANEVWSRKREEGFGKAQRRMHAFCGTLYGYSDLLKILPQEEKYTSILSGSLSALVKVRALCLLPSLVVLTGAFRHLSPMRPLRMDSRKGSLRSMSR